LKYLIRIDAIATDYLAPGQRRPTNPAPAELMVDRLTMPHNP